MKFLIRLHLIILNLFFEQIDSFTSINYKYDLIKVPGPEDCDNKENPSLLKYWSNSNVRLEFWLMKDGASFNFAIIFGTLDNFLILSNIDDHPYIITKDFIFNNSDGSTHENIDFIALDLNQTKYVLKSKTIEYIFKQIH